MLENHMVVGDYYSEGRGADKCDICGDLEFEMVQHGLDFYCSSCSRKCLWCNDFMLLEEGIILTDGEMHKPCHEDWVREQKEKS